MCLLDNDNMQVESQTINIGKGTEVGQIISCTVDGKDGQPQVCLPSANQGSHHFPSS